MTILLPANPAPASMTFMPVDFGGLLTPPTGADTQRLNRNGNRWSVSVQMPRMRPEDARVWIARLTAGLRQGVRLILVQVDFSVGTPGTPSVDGDGQAGLELAIGGAAAQYAFRVGQWVTLESDGTGHLYMIVEQSFADTSGDGSLIIEPPLRIEPADGDPVIVGQPYIEGSLASGGVPWTIDVARTIGLSFSVTEDR